MQGLELPVGRARYDEDGFALRISWPSRRNAFGALFLAAWMGGRYLGEKSAVEQIFLRPAHGPDGFLMFWLAG